MARVLVENQARSLPTPHPLTAAAREALRHGLTAFINMCGNRYIAGEVTGGLLEGSLHTSALAATELSDTRGDMTLHIGVFGSSAEFTTHKDVLEKSTQASFRILQYGGIGGVPKDFVGWVDQFPSKIQQNSGYAWRIRVDLGKYSGLLNGRIDVDLTEADAYLLRLADLYSTALSRRAELWYVASHPAEFAAPNDPNQMKALARQTDAAIAALDAAAASCRLDPTQSCRILPSAAIPPNPAGPR